jgi:hypothetical protein
MTTNTQTYDRSFPVLVIALQWKVVGLNSFYEPKLHIYMKWCCHANVFHMWDVSFDIVFWVHLFMTVSVHLHKTWEVLSLTNLDKYHMFIHLLVQNKCMYTNKGAPNTMDLSNSWIYLICLLTSDLKSPRPAWPVFSKDISICPVTSDNLQRKDDK